MTIPWLETVAAVPQWVEANQGLAAAGAGGFLALCGSVGAVRRHAAAQAVDTHGSSKWATPREIRRAGFVARQGVFLGRYGRWELWDNGHGHVLLVAPTESGKDRCHLFETTKRWKHGLILNDPAQQENWRTCGAWRRGPEGDWPVYCFDPMSRRSHSINILETVRVGELEEFDDVSGIVLSLLAPPKHVKDGTGPMHYRGLEVTLLRGTVLYTLYASPRKSFPGVLQVMSDRKKCLAAMKGYRHDTIQHAAQVVLNMGETEQQKVWTGGLQALDIYQSPLIAQHTEQSSFALRDLQYGPKPVTLYLCAQSTTQLTYLAPLYRSIFQGTLEHLKIQEDDGRQPLLWLINERPALGVMDVLDGATADIRHYGMRLCVVAQDLGQLFDVSGGNTPLWSTTATKIFHRLGSDETAERLQHMLGPETVEYTSRTKTRRWGEWGSRGTSTRRQGRPLLNLSELLWLPRDEALIVSTACDAPFRVKKVWYEG